MIVYPVQLIDNEKTGQDVICCGCVHFSEQTWHLVRGASDSPLNMVGDILL